jgi:hypothetical protein
MGRLRLGVGALGVDLSTDDGSVVADGGGVEEEAGVLPVARDVLGVGDFEGAGVGLDGGDVVGQ